MLSVVISSITSIRLWSPADVASRQPVISSSTLSISYTRFLVCVIVASFAIMWERFVFTALAMSWHFVANVHRDDFISSIVVARVTIYEYSYLHPSLTFYSIF
jgi:hypothetical protein